MPIMPRRKTQSEVATIQWIRQHTSLPVPKILAYEPSSKGPLGHEYIILEKIRGRTLADAWWDIDFPAKENLTRRIALFQSELFNHQMTSIGSMYEKVNKGETSFYLGTSTTTAFLTRNNPRGEECGPWESPSEWLSCHLDVAEADCRYRLKRAEKAEAKKVALQMENDETTDSNQSENREEQEGDDGGEEDDEEDSDDLERSILIIEKLRSHITDFFPGKEELREPTMICHDDMNKHNVLVDEAGQLTAVVDWECVSTLPLSVACQYPSFLQAKSNEIRPIKEIYQHDENGKVVELYWEHLEHYELHQLRNLFLDEMRKLQPQWVEVFERSQRQRDFVAAVFSYDDLFMMRRILKWMEDVESGGPDVMGLEERIDNDVI